MKKRTRNLFLGRVLSCILSAVMILPMLTACGRKEVNPQDIYQVYYLSTSETKVEMHEHIMEATTPEEQLQELVDCLSTMPEKLEYKAPLAMGYQVLSVTMKDGKVSLDVDVAYYDMPATTEVLVRAAIVRTLTQLDGVDYVGITVEGTQLYDNTNELVGWMSADQFIDNDGNEINTYELTKIKLYFANESGDRLIAAYREQYYSTNTPLERLVVEELIKGPSGQVEGIYPVINPETKIINAMTKDGICYVNLDSSFLTVMNNVSTEVAIYAIVDSLVELPSINKVQILINGEVPDSFSSSAYERNLDFVTTLNSN